MQEPFDLVRWNPDRGGWAGPSRRSSAPGDERQIVHGAIGYARELGLAQHPDFGRTAGYLVAWDGECELHDLRLTAGDRVALPFARDLALDLQPPDPGPSVYLLLDLGSISYPALIFPAGPDSSAWSVRRSPAADYW
jgi:hypothetical protein